MQRSETKERRQEKNKCKINVRQGFKNKATLQRAVSIFFLMQIGEKISLKQGDYAAIPARSHTYQVKTEMERRQKDSSPTEVPLSCSLNEAQSQSRNLAVL